MPPNTTDLKVCVEVAAAECGQGLLTAEVKDEPPVYKAETPDFRTCLPQVLATMAKSMLLFALGMLVGAPTVVIAALNKPSNGEEMVLTDRQASWFAGLLLIMQPTGSVLSGICQEILGRKRCMLLVNIPQLAGWLLIRFATTPEQLFLAALLMGFTVGFMEAPTLSYVGEIAQPHLRGILASFTSVYISAGLLVMFLMASFTDWRTSAALSTAVPIITLIAISQVPESPVWLILKGREKEAETSLRWLRGWTTADNVAKEFALLKDHLQSSRIVYSQIPINGCSETQTRRPKLKEKLKDVCRPALMRPLALVVLYFGFAQGAALSGARPYLYRVYKDLGVPIDPFLATVCSSATQIFGSLVCMGVVRRLGKRRLSLLSMGACALLLLGLGLYAYLRQTDRLHAPWLPLFLMAALTFATNAGIGVIPWALLSEVFPTRGRGIGGGIAAASYYIWFFIFTKTWLDFEALVNLYGVLYFYSFLGLLGFLYIYFFMPETEGKTLEEIEQVFKKKWLRI